MQLALTKKKSGILTFKRRTISEKLLLPVKTSCIPIVSHSDENSSASLKHKIVPGSFNFVVGKDICFLAAAGN